LAVTLLQKKLVSSAKKVSIENSNFKALSVENLADLNVNIVMEEIKKNLN